MSGTQRRVLLFILLTVALDSMGMGILSPVTPKLILELSGAGLAQAAVFGGWLTAAFAGMQFLAGPVLGSLSDRLGRRPVLLVSLAAFGLSYVLMGLAPTLAWLFAAQLLTGLFGATPATAGAYIADVTPPAERARHFGTLAAAFGTGLIIGPAAGGLLAEHGTRVPFFAAAALSLAAVAYGALALPESLRPELRCAFSWRRANPIGAIGALRRRATVGLLLTAVFLQRVATTALPATWPYFTMQEYGWTVRQVGYSLAVYGVAVVLFQVGVLRWLDAQFGTRYAAMLGLVGAAIGFIGFAFLRGPWIIATCIPLTTLGFMAGPALAGMLSVRMPSDGQGMLQGVMSSINGVAVVLTPLAMPWIFSVFSTGRAPLVFPGAPYVLSAALALAGVVCIQQGSRVAEA
ncbi:MAG: MFS transporter [Gammaproteobacteria bacterium]|nr:MFS transporter [Gammaproteobacteria bacterium]